MVDVDYEDKEEHCLKHKNTIDKYYPVGNASIVT